MRKRRSQACYCAFCRSPRSVYMKKHLSAGDTALALLVSLLLMILVWQDFDPRFLVFWVGAMICAEIFVVLRWRLALTCVRCGFDPVIYKRDPAKAAARVREFISRRAEDPFYALQPALDLPVLVRKKTDRSRLNTRV